jgi:hypothetical protein
MATKRKRKRTRRSHKRRGAVMKGAMIAGAAAIIAGFVPVSHPALTRTVKEVAAAAGRSRLGSVSVRLWRGVSIDTFAVYGSAPDGSTIDLFARHMRIGYNPLGLIRNRSRLRHQTTELARSLFTLRPGGPTPDWITSISLRGARLTASGGARRPLRIDSASLVIRPRDTGNIDVGGSAGSALLGDWSLTRCSVDLQASQDRLVIRKVRARAYGGTVVGRAHYGFQRGVITAGSLRLRRIDLSAVHRAHTSKEGALSGVLDAELHVRPPGFKPDSALLYGTVSASRIRADSIPLLRTIVLSLSLPRLSSIRLEQLGGPVRLVQDRIVCDSLIGAGAPASVVISGDIDFAGDMDLAVEGVFDKEYADSLPAFTWEAMPPTSDGGRSFRCSFHGTFDYPRVRIDRTHRRRAVSTLFRGIGRGIGSLFGDKDPQ